MHKNKFGNSKIGLSRLLPCRWPFLFFLFLVLIKEGGTREEDNSRRVDPGVEGKEGGK
jgi:hypothetical protein